MKIEKIQIKQDRLYLSFSESEFGIVLSRVLKYVKYQNLKHYYFLYYDSFFNHDIFAYFEDYPMLEERIQVGCFEIKREDIDDITFMYKIMTQFHSCYLYVNNDPDFLRFYNPKYRVQEFPDNLGYIAYTDISDGIGIHRAADMPDWDLSKLGVDAEEIINSD